MKKLIAAVLFAGFVATGWSATTIDPANQFAYGANFAWVNWQGDVANGAIVTEDVCSGFIWSANCGWLHLGDGSPTNGLQYQNNSDDDYGVNLDAAGNLNGYAYGANIGWVHFEPVGQPRIDLLTGNFNGSVWSPNCGWISLSNAQAHVRTLAVLPGADTDHDGLPDGWELRFARTLDELDGSGDPDRDGVSNHDEALADTNPLDPNDALMINGFEVGSNGTFTLNWLSHPTRLYRLLKKPDLGAESRWEDSGLGLLLPDPGGETSILFNDTGGPQGFYRIEAIKPLAP